MEPLYFGVWRAGEAGHYLHNARGRHLWSEDAVVATLPAPWRPFGALDAKLCPPRNCGGCYGCRNGGWCSCELPQIEGAAWLTHLDGWTALAFWDRSGDSRGGSNSAFLLPGTLTFDEAVTVARAAFPSIWARFTFPIVPDGG